MKRRDEFGWLTYPFWTLLARYWPLHASWCYRGPQGRLSRWVAFEIATRAYGEELRWQLRDIA